MCTNIESFWCTPKMNMMYYVSYISLLRKNTQWGKDGLSNKCCMEMLSVQFSHSVMSDYLWPMDCSTPGFPVHHQLLELALTHVHQVGDAIQPFHPLLSPSPPTFNLPQHQGLFQWVNSSHQVAKVLEFQLQHQSFQWIFRTDFL